MYWITVTNRKQVTRYIIIVIGALITFNLVILWVPGHGQDNIHRDTTIKDTGLIGKFWSILLQIYVRPCPPPKLEGAIVVTFEKPAMGEIENRLQNVEYGGKWEPRKCKSHNFKTVVIVPYRDREDHLRIFLNYLHTFLQRQLLDYTVFIVEQAPGSQFNRGMLLNIGFLESLKLDDYKCVIFHDVDLLPEDDRNMYTCSEGSVLHLSAHVDEFAYRLPYPEIMGGAASFWSDDFAAINGFSNQFFGWGGEDDDLYNRIRYHGLNVTRYPKVISRYKMIRHRKIYPNKERFKFLQTGDRRFLTDGLNSVQYKRISLQKLKLFTRLYVDIHDNHSNEVMNIN